MKKEDMNLNKDELIVDFYAEELNENDSYSGITPLISCNGSFGTAASWGSCISSAGTFGTAG